jgi:hypothetical protein
VGGVLQRQEAFPTTAMGCLVGGKGVKGGFQTVSRIRNFGCEGCWPLWSCPPYTLSCIEWLVHIAFHPGQSLFLMGLDSFRAATYADYYVCGA